MIWWIVALGVIGLWSVGEGLLMILFALAEIIRGLFAPNPWEDD